MYLQASVGISIEQRRLSLVCLKRTLKGVRLTAHAAYPLEKDDTAEQIAEIKRHVHAFLTGNDATTADIYLGLRRDLAIVRYIDLPLAVRENLRASISYEMEKYIPLPVNDIYFDCQIVAEDRDAGSMKVLLIGVRKEFIDPFLDPENPLGAGISAVEINATAWAGFLSSMPGAANEEDCAVLCLEQGRIELDLVRKGLLHYSRHVKWDKDAAGAEGAVLAELGLLGNARGSGKGPLKILLCGADAAGIAEPLRRREDIALYPLDPAETGVPSAVLAPAYGLALRGIRKTPMGINLLPAGHRKKAGRTGYYAMIVLAGLAVLSLLAWGGSYLLHQKLVSDRLESEIKQLGTEVEAVHRTEAKIAEIEQKIDAVNALRKHHAPALSVLLELSKDIPPGVWLERFNLTENGGDLEGYADSASALIPKLAESPLLKDVAFLAPITKGADGKERFRIGFKIR